MAEVMIRQNAGHHRFAHRHRADADARVVAAFGENIRIMPRFVDGLARRED